MDYYPLIQIIQQERMKKAEMNRLYRQAAGNTPSFAARGRLRIVAFLSAIGNLHRTHYAPRLGLQQHNGQLDGDEEHLPALASGQVYTEGQSDL